MREVAHHAPTHLVAERMLLRGFREHACERVVDDERNFTRRAGDGETIPNTPVQQRVCGQFEGQHLNARQRRDLLAPRLLGLIVEGDFTVDADLRTQLDTRVDLVTARALIRFFVAALGQLLAGQVERVVGEEIETVDGIHTRADFTTDHVDRVALVFPSAEPNDVAARIRVQSAKPGAARLQRCRTNGSQFDEVGDAVVIRRYFELETIVPLIQVARLERDDAFRLQLVIGILTTFRR